MKLLRIYKNTIVTSSGNISVEINQATPDEELDITDVKEAVVKEYVERPTKAKLTSLKKQSRLIDRKNKTT